MPATCCLFQIASYDLSTHRITRQEEFGFPQPVRWNRLWKTPRRSAEKMESPGLDTSMARCQGWCRTFGSWLPWSARL